MNRYMIIDFEKLEILSLNEIDIDSKNNDIYTSSITCVDEVDLIKTTNDELMNGLICYLKNKGVVDYENN